MFAPRTLPLSSLFAHLALHIYLAAFRILSHERHGEVMDESPSGVRTCGHIRVQSHARCAHGCLLGRRFGSVVGVCFSLLLPVLQPNPHGRVLALPFQANASISAAKKEKVGGKCGPCGLAQIFSHAFTPSTRSPRLPSTKKCEISSCVLRLQHRRRRRTTDQYPPEYAFIILLYGSLGSPWLC